MSRRILPALLGLTLAVRVVAMLRTGVVSTDGVNFAYMAQEFAALRWGEALAQDQHPLYPAAVSLLTLPAVSLAAALALAFLLWRLSARTFGLEAAAWATGLFALHPLFVENTSDFLSEVPCLVFVAGGWLVLARWIVRPAPAAEALLGVLAGLGYLTRQESIELFLGIAILCVWGWARGQVSPARSARLLMVSTAAFLLVVFPYLLYLRSEEGCWMISRKKGFFALFPWLDPDYGAHPSATQLGTILAPLAVQAWIHSVQFWKTFAGKFMGAFHPWILLWALVGGVGSLRRRDRPHPLPLLAIFFWVHVGVALVQLNGAGYLEKRHLLLAVLAALPWAGAALARMAAPARKKRTRLATLTLILLATLTLILLSYGTLWSVTWGLDQNFLDRLRYARLHPLPERRADYAGRGVYRDLGRWFSDRPDWSGGIACPRTREGQWIAYYAAAPGAIAVQREFFLYDAKGGRLPLTRQILERCTVVVCSPAASREYAKLLGEWAPVPIPEKFVPAARRVRDWIVYSRKEPPR